MRHDDRSERESDERRLDEEVGVPEEAASPPDQPGAKGDPGAEGITEKPLTGELEPLAPAREPTGDGLLKDPAGPGA